MVQHDLPIQDAVEVHPIDCLNVRWVHPLQLAHAGYAPGRERRLTQHVKEGCRIARDNLARLFQLAAGGAFFQSLDGGVGDPDDRPRASRPPVRLKEAARRPDDGERESLSSIAQLAHANPQRRVLSGTVTRFEVGKAFDDAHCRIGRNRIVGEAEQASQCHRRTVKLRRGHFFTIGLKRLTLPDQDYARVSTKD